MVHRLFNLLDAKGRGMEAQIAAEVHDSTIDWRAELWDSGYVVGVVEGTSATFDTLEADVQAKVLENDIRARTAKN
jgi:hypothetical protein